MKIQKGQTRVTESTQTAAYKTSYKYLYKESARDTANRQDLRDAAHLYRTDIHSHFSQLRTIGE